ncbi:MAG: hypothetical protein ACTHQQ_09250 [Solirubrobacteraceae bacterium]
MADAVVLHPITGPPGSRLAALLGHGLEPVAPFRGTIGGFARVVASVSAAESEIAAARRGLPDGDALSEAVAVRLLRSGHEIVWGPPLVVDSVRSLLEFCRSRGRSAVELARSDPSLVPELQIGAWFDAPWRTRSLRSFAGAESNDWIARLALLSERWLKTAADFAFWAGARDRSTAPEWRRLTRSSYVALVYHRFAGELKPGQERIDIAPRRFERQLRALRMIRCHPLSPEEVLSFHVGRADRLADRSFVITVDDALADCVLPLARHSQWSRSCSSAPRRWAEKRIGSRMSRSRHGPT